jgi:hypothetical protein
MAILGIIGTVVAVVAGIYGVARTLLKDREDKRLIVRATFHHEINMVTLEPRFETQGILVTATYQGSQTITLDSIQFKHVDEKGTHVMNAINPNFEMKQGKKFQKHLIAIDQIIEPASTARSMVLTDIGGKDYPISKKEMKAIRKRALELVVERRAKRAK